MSVMKAMLDIVHADTVLDTRETLLIDTQSRAVSDPARAERVFLEG